MHGNVWEWVEDCWHDNYKGAPTDGRAWTTDCVGLRRAVLRGGSLIDKPRALRCAVRDWVKADTRDYDFGFRVVRDLKP